MTGPSRPTAARQYSPLPGASSPSGYRSRNTQVNNSPLRGNNIAWAVPTHGPLDQCEVARDGSPRGLPQPQPLFGVLEAQVAHNNIIPLMSFPTIRGQLVYTVDNDGFITWEEPPVGDGAQPTGPVIYRRPTVPEMTRVPRSAMASAQIPQLSLPFPVPQQAKGFVSHSGVFPDESEDEEESESDGDEAEDDKSHFGGANHGTLRP
ncbi:hypothetical protein H1R20_g1307, partial [Candolleomyces eurysporus]